MGRPAQIVDSLLIRPVEEGVNMGDQGEWLPLSSASQKLGVSVQTLRRRIKDKQIEARQATTPFGFAWEVLIGSVDRGGEGLSTRWAMVTRWSTVLLRSHPPLQS